jgi:hypothetical protein
MSSRFHTLFVSGMSVVVIATIAWGFYLVGSPEYRRLQRVDERRLDELKTIANEIRSIVKPNHEKELREPVPATLEEAAKRARHIKIALRDPESGEPYRYVVKSETTFEICAKFALPRNSDLEVFWNHPAGQHCFTVDLLNPP